MGKPDKRLDEDNVLQLAHMLSTASICSPGKIQGLGAPPVSEKTKENLQNVAVSPSKGGRRGGMGQVVGCWATRDRCFAARRKHDWMTREAHSSLARYCGLAGMHTCTEAIASLPQTHTPTQCGLRLLRRSTKAQVLIATSGSKSSFFKKN